MPRTKRPIAQRPGAARAAAARPPAPGKPAARPASARKVAARPSSPRQAARIRATLAELRPIDELAAVFASLGSAPRLRLLYLLYHRPDLKVGELAELAGLTISGVSTHLRKLRNAGLVCCRRDKQSICCYLPAEGEHVRFVGLLFRQIAEQTGCCC